MRRFAIFCVAYAVVLTATLLGVTRSDAWLIQGNAGCNAHYCGPGDYLALDAFYSCTYAVSYAYALPGNNLGCNVGLKSQDNDVMAACDAVFKPIGVLDTDTTLSCESGMKTLDQFLAVARLTSDAHGNGSASGTAVLTITSCTTCTFQPYMRVTTNVWIISFGTGSGGAGTYNLNTNATLSGAITGSKPSATVAVAYDQIGTNDLTPDASVNSPRFRPSTGGASSSFTSYDCGFSAPATGLPCMAAAGNGTYDLFGGSGTVPNPLMILAVGNSEGGNTMFLKVFGANSSSAGGNAMDRVTNPNWRFNAVDGGGSDVWSAGIGSLTAGSDLFFNVNGSETTSSGTIQDGASGPIKIFNRTSQVADTGAVGESGYGSITTDATLRCQIIVNDNKRYGTPKGSC